MNRIISVSHPDVPERRMYLGAKYSPMRGATNALTFYREDAIRWCRRTIRLSMVEARELWPSAADWKVERP